MGPLSTHFRSALPLALLFVAALFVAGCTTTQQHGPSSAVTRAQLHITNLTPYTWSVVASRDGAPVQSTQVGKFAIIDLSLTEGDYEIEQTLLDAPLATVPARRFAVRFESGESYQWSLATLQSATEGARHE